MRRYAMIATQIWRDDDFVTLSPGAQRLYMLLLSRPNISACGTLPLQTRRWAALSRETTEDDVRSALDELAGRRFVVVDETTEEIAVRTFVKHDVGNTNDTRKKAIFRAAEAIESRVIGWALRAEFEKLNLPTDGLPEGPPDDPSDDPTEGASDDHVFPSPVTTVSTDWRREPEPGEGNREPGTGNLDNSAIELAEPPRPDVEAICGHLADRIEANGAKRPTITAKWRDSARLMLDRDGRSEDQVHAAIDWSQDDEFWRSNILSMPKLRSQYDQLRLQAQRGQNAKPSTTDQRVAAGLALAEKYAQEGR